MLGLTNLCNNLVDECDDGLVDLMRLVNRLNHLCFRHLVCTCLDHDNLFSGGCNSQIQIPALPLLLGRVHNQLSIYQAHLGHGTGTIKRNIGNTGSDCGTDHCHQFRTALGINTHYHIIQSNIITVILRE